MAAKPRRGFTAFSPGDDRSTLRHRLNPDELGELMTESEARIADLTNEVGLVCDEPNDLIFAKTDFPQPRLHCRSG